MRGFQYEGDCYLKVNVKASLQKTYAVTGISYQENGCCADKPILITVTAETANTAKPVYSCQCACGFWCTTGHFNDWEALKDYEEMTRRAKEEKENDYTV